MTFAAPWALAWLGLLAPLVALYILRRRRERRVVGSTMLWSSAMRDLRAERPFQRLRPHLSLLLQALAIVAGALALARPSDTGHVPAGARVVVVVDVSTSMAARDAGDVSRLSRAREASRQLARSLPPEGSLMIIAAGAEPEVRVAPSDDRAVLESALDELRVGGPGADLEGAVALAAERVRDAAPGSRILVFTDAAFDGVAALSAPVPIEVQRVTRGPEPVNHAIVAMDVRPRRDADSPDGAEIFARVVRYGEGSAEVRLTASVVGGALLGSRRVTLSDGEPMPVVMRAELPPDASARGAFVAVELEVLEGDDALEADNRAAMPSPAARRLPAFLVGETPPAVTRVLSTDPDVELFQVAPGGLSAPDAPRDGLFVYTGRVPDGAPDADAVVVAPTGDSIFGVTLGEAVERPTVISWDEADPRLRFVRFSDVHLGAVRPLRGAGSRALLTTDAGAAIAVLERQRSESLIIGFDPHDGDWTSRPDFVVFFRNLLERARERRARGGIPEGEFGSPIRVPADDGETVRLVEPSGRAREIEARGGYATFAVEARPGVYRAEVGGRTRHATRNLLSAAESDVRPRATFEASEGGAEVATVEPQARRELWPWFAGALLLLLTLELTWATRGRR